MKKVGQRSLAAYHSMRFSALVTVSTYSTLPHLLPFSVNSKNKIIRRSAVRKNRYAVNEKESWHHAETYKRQTCHNLFVPDRVYFQTLSGFSPTMHRNTIKGKLFKDVQHLPTRIRNSVHWNVSGVRKSAYNLLVLENIFYDWHAVIVKTEHDRTMNLRLVRAEEIYVSSEQTNSKFLAKSCPVPTIKTWQAKV